MKQRNSTSLLFFHVDPYEILVEKTNVIIFSTAEKYLSKYQITKNIIFRVSR